MDASRRSGSVVVTGAGGGVGRALVERLLEVGHAVVALDRDADALAWASAHPAATRLSVVAGDGADAKVTEHAADVAEQHAPLVGWVNDAAVFRDASLDVDPSVDVLAHVHANLALAVTGSGTAVRRFVASGTAGSIVQVSSHQAQRAVRGALPYATAKAAIEGLTRAMAVDHGPQGIRTNAVALGSITTERYERLLGSMDADEAQAVRDEVARLHPLGRIGQPREVADVVAWLVGPESSFVNGAVVPVDGGRAARGPDPEER